jgi:hypothetical protein
MKSKNAKKSQKKPISSAAGKGKKLIKKPTALAKAPLRTKPPKKIEKVKPEPQNNPAPIAAHQNPFIEAMKKQRERDRSAFAQKKGNQANKFKRGQFSGFGGRRAA